MRKKRVLVAVVAACASMAIVGVASATAFTNFNSTSAPVKLKGTQTETSVFTTDAGKAECKEATFVGESAVTKSETQEVAPTYSKCSFLGILEVPVRTIGCKYLFHAAGTVDVKCETGKFIEFEAESCLIKVGSQNGLSSIAFANIGSGITASINVTPNVSGIEYTESKLCPGNLTGGTVTKKNGTYTGGKASVVGKNSKETASIGLFMS